MTAEHIIGIYVVIEETMSALGHTSHQLATVSDAEVLTVAVVAAAFFGNHHERTLVVLRAPGYLSHALSTCAGRLARPLARRLRRVVRLRTGRALRFRHRQHARPGLQAGAGAALSHRPRAGLLRLLRG